MEAEQTNKPQELVWGIGISTWRLTYEKGTFSFEYPLLTQAVEISLDDRTMAIELRPRATDTRVEFDALTACHVEGAIEVEIEKNITERKQAEEALKKSEALLRSIVSASPVGIALETTGRAIIWVNDAMARNSGYSSKELEGRSARIFYASDEEFARVGEIVHSEAGHGGISVTETRFLGKDGQARDVQLTAAPVDARDASAGIVFAVADITERKRAEEELQKAHRRLSDIIDFLPDATFVIDREKRVVAWNKAIEEMTGLKKEEILGKGDYAYAVPFYGKPRPIVIDLVFERNEEMEKTYDHVQRAGQQAFRRGLRTEDIPRKGRLSLCHRIASLRP